MLHEATDDEYDAVGKSGTYDHFFSDEQKIELSSFEPPHLVEVFHRIYMHNWLVELCKTEKGF